MTTRSKARGNLPSRFDEVADRLVDALAPRMVERVSALIAERFGDLPPLLDAAGAGRYLGIDEATVRNWARDGRLPTIRLGDGPKSRLRFDPQALREHLSSPANVTK